MHNTIPFCGLVLLLFPLITYLFLMRGRRKRRGYKLLRQRLTTYGESDSLGSPPILTPVHLWVLPQTFSGSALSLLVNSVTSW